jgi:hypothetical protein
VVGVPSPLVSAWSYITQLRVVADILPAPWAARRAGFSAQAEASEATFTRSFLRPQPLARTPRSPTAH